MKVEGNGNKVRWIEMEHTGASLKLNHLVKQDYFPVAEKQGDVDLVNFQFDDLREVDMMIDMLVNFRNSCADFMGICHKISSQEPLDKMFKG